MSDKSRRKLLKSIAAGSGAIVAGKSLPESWTKPVVDSVMLPAHAQTSEVAAGPGSQVFSFTGADQPFIVPAGVTSISITALGASGGNGSAIGGVGGLGGQASGTLTVTPGEALNIYVGGAGQDDAPNGAAGGFNGGGDRGSVSCVNSGADAGSGGGASDVRQGGALLANRAIVAAGGGGAHDTQAGGAGGGTTGDSGENVGSVYTNPTGGTQVAGGIAGSGGVSGCGPATDGSLGQGGTGDGNDGGGGGGGYYGGGGGSNNGGGAGGSSYTGGVAGGSTTSGANTGNGQVTLTW